MERFKIKKYEVVTIFILVFLPLSEFFSSSLDELLAVISVFYIGYAFVYERIKKDEIHIILLMLVITFLGGVSNAVSGLIDNYFAIVIDALEFNKVIVVFLSFRIFFRNKDFSSISCKVYRLAKLIIVVAFICAFISQFGDIGMTMRHADGKIYKEFGVIQPFGFYTRNGMQTYYLISGCLLFILAAETKKKSRVLYTILYLFINILTGTTLAIAGNILLVVLLYYYSKRKRLKVSTLLIIASVVVCFAFPAINEYLFNLRAPRAVLMYYGFLTAITYFPFGSGFASYGGEMAARYYSPLYWKYGFDDRYGLSHSGYGGILNDDYVAMVAAQFGWFGLVLFGFVYWKIFKLFDLKNISKRVKPLMMAIFGTICCSMMISANSKTLMGVWVYAILGMCSTSFSIKTNQEYKIGSQ